MSRATGKLSYNRTEGKLRKCGNKTKIQQEWDRKIVYK
jgi:hypothetical protein